MIRYYDMYGLLCFSIEGSGKLTEHLCAQCTYFLTDSLDREPDIQIVLGAFESIADKNVPYRIVNRKYCVAKDVIYAQDSYKTARWKMQIEGLDSAQTRFLFDGNGWSKYILHKSFVETVIRYKLNQKGCFMVHSSSVAVDGKGIVFPASPEAGKTSTMLKYLNNGQQFMSDDFSLIDCASQTVYAYPTPITLHSHNLERHPFLREVLSAKEKREIRWRTAVLRMTLGQGDISYKVDIWTKMGENCVAPSAPLCKLLLLSKCSGDEVRRVRLSREEFAEKLQIVNYFETVLFNAYLEAYRYGNPQAMENEFWQKMRRNIADLLREDEYEEIQIPRRYSEDVFSAIDRFVRE